MLRKIFCSQQTEGERGATLVELVIVILVVAVISLLTGKSFQQSVASFDYIDRRKEILSEARVGALRAMREITKLRDRRDVLVANGTSLSFTDIDNNTITLSWDGTPGSDFILTKNGASNILCARVDTLTFQYLKSDGTQATPLVSPNPTDIWRVVMRLNLKKGDEEVVVRTSEFVRNL